MSEGGRGMNSVGERIRRHTHNLLLHPLLTSTTFPVTLCYTVPTVMSSGPLLHSLGISPFTICSIPCSTSWSSYLLPAPLFVSHRTPSFALPSLPHTPRELSPTSGFVPPTALLTPLYRCLCYIFSSVLSTSCSTCITSCCT